MKNTTAHILSAIGIVLVLALASFNFQSYLNSQQVLGAKTEIKNNPQQTFWKNFLVKNPTYFPGWIELAKIDQVNGNLSKSLEDLDKAKSINPNAPEVN